MYACMYVCMYVHIYIYTYTYCICLQGANRMCDLPLEKQVDVYLPLSFQARLWSSFFEKMYDGLVHSFGVTRKWKE